MARGLVGTHAPRRGPVNRGGLRSNRGREPGGRLRRPLGCPHVAVRDVPALHVAEHLGLLALPPGPAGRALRGRPLPPRAGLLRRRLRRGPDRPGHAVQAQLLDLGAVPGHAPGPLGLVVLLLDFFFFRLLFLLGRGFRRLLESRRGLELGGLPVGEQLGGVQLRQLRRLGRRRLRPRRPLRPRRRPAPGIRRASSSFPAIRAGARLGGPARLARGGSLGMAAAPPRPPRTRRRGAETAPDA